MLNVGWTELVLIGVLLLVFVGPEKLPGVMRWAGRQYGMLRRTANELQMAFMDEVDEDARRKNPAARRPSPWTAPPAGLPRALPDPLADPAEPVESSQPVAVSGGLGDGVPPAVEGVAMTSPEGQETGGADVWQGD